MNKPFIEIDAENFTISPFDAKPIAGYEPPVNKVTGEQFPNCCPHHKDVLEQAEKWFEKFPNCCEPHKLFTRNKGFKKENYNGVASKIVRQLSYTEHHISERIKNQDWYNDITDYIEYNVSSFGHPAVGLHLYLNTVRHHVQNTKADLNQEQRQRLSEFIDGYWKTNDAPKTDLNILYKTYQNWLKIFPFELTTYFGNLKQHFEKQLPILTGKPETNRYTGTTKAKMHTKGSLIEALIKLTDSLLTQINGAALYEKGLITDGNKIKLELVINNRKQKLKDGYNYNSPDEETRYKKMIQYWFNDEKKFIDEITPLIKPSPSTPAEAKTDNETIEIKPTLKTEAVQTVFDILKDFFSPEQQTELKTILETGNNASKKLLFKANGNRLTDTFKKLIEGGFITGCQKQDLIQWIISNFNYLHRNQVKVFLFDTVEKTISRNDTPCKRPLIEINTNGIKKVGTN